MLEILVVALLVWLWVIERRLNTLRDSVSAMKLDLDGMRAMRSRAAAEIANPPPGPAGLPEVSEIQRRKVATS
jgi:hypothetical protein